MKCPQQFAAAPWVAFHELAWFEARVRDIASASARYAHLRERMRGCLIHRHLAGGAEFLGTRDGGKKTCRSAPDNDYAHFLSHERTLRHRRSESKEKSIEPEVEKYGEERVSLLRNLPGLLVPFRARPAAWTQKMPPRAAIRGG